MWSDSHTPPLGGGQPAERAVGGLRGSRRAADRELPDQYLSTGPAHSSHTPGPANNAACLDGDEQEPALTQAREARARYGQAHHAGCWVVYFYTT